MLSVPLHRKLYVGLLPGTMHGFSFYQGACPHDLCCFEPQTTIGVQTISSLDEDSRNLENLTRGMQ